ncbi:MAG: patatin-like phospholipase family protein [Flavobacteriaceae bacterium]|nr:patatin-like phospholipase family protein [Muriicola sp.]NNC61704.1 patatin-like phospholipase family protein [Eudoraea sp.]NNK21345.1 patatin-like phospholipase family protein [Flavobacteriaceae bacterium]NNL40592.1 patatin-like phospholipase family protein [Flavobacteriaceae bacterium]
MKKIGLALGGGAVLGAAHIGVLKALKEKDLEICYVTGTSIGAFVAALYAFGKSWDEIRDIASELKWMDISSISLSRYSLLSNDKFGTLITDNIGDKKIEDAQIPLAIITTDAGSGEKVVLRKGPVAEAVMASTCIPGLFNPVKLDGRMLLDGGIVENVPIKTLRNIGADYVIGVDLNAKHAYGDPANILDVLLNSFHFIMQQAAALQTEHADLLIKPDLSAFGRADTSQIEGLIQKGYEDTRDQLSKKELNLSTSWFGENWNKLLKIFDMNP